MLMNCLNLCDIFQRAEGEVMIDGDCDIGGEGRWMSRVLQRIDVTEIICNGILPHTCYKRIRTGF